MYCESIFIDTFEWYSKNSRDLTNQEKEREKKSNVTHSTIYILYPVFGVVRFGFDDRFQR